MAEYHQQQEQQLSSLYRFLINLELSVYMDVDKIGISELLIQVLNDY